MALAGRPLPAGLHYAIVDEVDSILIDEARTPLIISGRPTTPSCTPVNQIVPSLAARTKEDRAILGDESRSRCTCRPGGRARREMLRGAGILGGDAACTRRRTSTGAPPHARAMRAQADHQRDVDYIVRDGEVVIVDEFTGRTMPGRRWSDGLHQAVEAKASPIQRENQTLASVTFQNLFRMYKEAGSA